MIAADASLYPAFSPVLSAAAHSKFETGGPIEMKSITIMPLPRSITTPLTRQELRGLVRESEIKYQDMAIAEARQGRTQCRFQTTQKERVELLERFKRLFPGCAVYVDPIYMNMSTAYGTCFIVVDWS